MYCFANSKRLGGTSASVILREISAAKMTALPYFIVAVNFVPHNGTAAAIQRNIQPQENNAARTASVLTRYTVSAYAPYSAVIILSRRTVTTAAGRIQPINSKYHNHHSIVCIPILRIIHAAPKTISAAAAKAPSRWRVFCTVSKGAAAGIFSIRRPKISDANSGDCAE